MRTKTEWFLNQDKLNADIRKQFPKNTSLREMAVTVDLSAASLSRMFRGRGDVLDTRSLFAICAALGLDPRDYIDLRIWELREVKDEK